MTNFFVRVLSKNPPVSMAIRGNPVIQPMQNVFMPLSRESRNNRKQTEGWID